MKHKARRIVRVLNSCTERLEHVELDILDDVRSIKNRYSELKGKSSFTEAAEQAQTEWVEAQLNRIMAR